MTPRLLTQFAFAGAAVVSGCALSHARDTDAGARREDAPQEDAPQGDRAPAHSPQRVLADVAEITTGSTVHTCALLNNGTARCWGSNDYGQLGDGNTMTLSTVPVQVIGVP